MNFTKKISLLCLLFLPISAFAQENGVTVVCPAMVKKDEVFTCEIKGYSDFEVSAIEYQFQLNETVEKVNFLVDAIWEGDEENNLVLIYTADNKLDEFTIGTITLKAKEDVENFSIKTERLLFGDNQFNAHTLVDRGERPKVTLGVQEDVKEVKTEIKNVKKNYKNYIYCGIIVLIIGLLGLFLRRKEKLVVR